MRFLARALVTLTFVLVVSSLVAAFVLPGQGDLVIGVIFSFLATGSALTGYLVATRVPTSLIGWLLLAQGIGMALVLAPGEVAALGLHLSSSPSAVFAVCGWCADLLGRVVVVVPTGLLLLVFPTGRFQSRAWTAFAALFVLVLTASGVTDMLLVNSVGPGIDNPFQVHGSAADIVHTCRAVAMVAAVPVAIGCAVSLFLRLRHSRGAERQRVKWIAYTAAVAVVGFGVALAVDGPLGDLAWNLALLCVVLLPVSMGVAILRHRLFDIDVVIKRTLVYSILTVSLLSTYLLLVLVLQLLLQPVAGNSDLAVAGSTLAVAALFGPLRRLVQKTVDRRFFRSRYDAALTLDAFAEHLRDEVDLSALGEDLQLVVAQTMQPAHVSLWLRERP
jgi:hypothetical protein